MFLGYCPAAVLLCWLAKRELLVVPSEAVRWERCKTVKGYNGKIARMSKIEAYLVVLD